MQSSEGSGTAAPSFSRRRPSEGHSCRALAWAAALGCLLSACELEDVTRLRGEVRDAQPLPAVEPELAVPEPVVAEADAGARELPDAGSSSEDAGIRAPPQPAPDAAPPAVAAFDCSRVPAAPIEFETLEGFEGSEDFAFDQLGNYVGVDVDNNLVRISRDGQRQLWVPKLGGTAGMAMLRDGSLVFNQVEDGAIKRVYPNGSVSVLLGGLLYPNGLDIGPDGFIYVAENGAGRVRRVDPDTGEFSVIAMGLQGPNGVAFSPDPNVLFIGSFEGSGVYEVELPGPGQLGVAKVFARPNGSRLREPTRECAGRQLGAACKPDLNLEGRCQAIANVVDCVAVDPCPGLPERALCDYPSIGRCVAGVCLEPCTGLALGAACEDFIGEPGVCADSGDGKLYCGFLNSCDGQSAGAPCIDLSDQPGKCVEFMDDPTLYCYPLDPCDTRSEGDACRIEPFGPGTCRADGGPLTCTPANPCERLTEGAPCTDFFSTATGTCRAHEPGLPLYCVLPDPCAGHALGAACVDPYTGPGTCAGDAEYVYCEPPGPCAGLAEGAPCDDESLGPGTCKSADGELRCSFECDPRHWGAPCMDADLRYGSCDLFNRCTADPPGGGIDGLAVDVCGNVYASEFSEGNVWRVSPAGEIELLARLPSSWIPNMKWGQDRGGFSSHVLYVADRESGRLFGLPVVAPDANDYSAGVP
jgi:sugar lactone lactonase YvrE